MGTHDKTVRLEAVATADDHVLSLVLDGAHVGSVARDDKNPTSKTPWAWRLLLPDGRHDSPLAGQSTDIGQALSDAAHALENAKR
jgi:hypothetical protein